MIKFTEYSLNRSEKFIEVFTKKEIGLHEKANFVRTYGRVKVALLKGQDKKDFHTLIIGEPDMKEKLVFMQPNSPELPKAADSCWMSTLEFFSYEDLESFLKIKSNTVISESTFKLLLRNGKIERIENVFGNNSGIRYFIKK